MEVLFTFVGETLNLKVVADKISSNQNFLRTTAIIVALFGAVGSLYFMFKAGRENSSVVLLGLFTGWVLSPFAALFIANKIANRWRVLTRLSLYSLMVFLAISSVVAYSGILIPPGTKPAFIFLVVPLISWLLIVTVIQIARRWSRNN